MAGGSAMSIRNKFLLLSASFLLASPAANAIVAQGVDGQYYVVQELINASQIYQDGINGDGLNVAMTEGFNPNYGHESSGVQFSNSPERPWAATITYTGHSGIWQTDDHATSVAHAYVGRNVDPSDVENVGCCGIAYGADLVTGANGYGLNGALLGSPYYHALETGFYKWTDSGVYDTSEVHYARIFNSSWGRLLNGGFGKADISDSLRQSLDAVVVEYDVLDFWSAGNGQGNGTPLMLSSGFNSIAIGNIDTRGVINPTSSRGRVNVTDYDGTQHLHEDIGVTIDGEFYATTTARNVVDLVTIGTSVVLATGNGSAYAPTTGTSFASPIAAGASALLVDAAMTFMPDNTDADNALVIKSVMQTGASKDVYDTTAAYDAGTSSWNNDAYDKDGVWTTHYGLDGDFGAGALDVDTAYSILMDGTTGIDGVGDASVDQTGWDYNSVSSQDTTRTYLFDDMLAGGSTFAATLNWFTEMDAQFNLGTNSNHTYDGGAYPGDAAGFPGDPALDVVSFQTSDGIGSFMDLDLQLVEFDAFGNEIGLVAESNSLINPTEHIYFELPSDGYYGLRVNWDGAVWDTSLSGEDSLNGVNYGVSWNATSLEADDFPGSDVPMPASLPFMAAALVFLRKRT